MFKSESSKVLLVFLSSTDIAKQDLRGYRQLREISGYPGPCIQTQRQSVYTKKAVLRACYCRRGKLQETQERYGTI